MKTRLLLLSALPVVLLSCAGTKKLKNAEAKYGQLDSAYLQLQKDYRECQGNLRSKEGESVDFSQKRKAYESQITDLQKQIDFLKNNNSSVLSQLQNLSVVTGAQAESIKKSLDNIGSKDLYIKNLQSSLAYKDSLNRALVNNLKSALNDVNDQDVNVKVEKGVVYIDISDKMLFKSGSYDVTTRAKEVLGKVAKVLNAHPDIEFMVEGHTDTNPYSNGVLLDNWDLSTKRATAVTRILQHTYNLDPKRITAAGRSEYLPVADNSTAEGRAANRRTRIVILPQLDQFFKLMEKKNP